MKHHKSQRKFGRVRKVRTGLLRGLVRSLVLHERIETTIAKARELRPQVEKLVTMAKKAEKTAKNSDVPRRSFRRRSRGVRFIARIVLEYCTVSKGSHFICRTDAAIRVGGTL